MANYSFDTGLAKKYGSVTVAVFVKNFDFWLSKNAANDKNYHDGRYWTHNSSKALADLFEWMSPSQVYRTIQKMIDLNILIKGNYNKKGYDQTAWYAFSDSFIESEKSILQYHKLHFTKSQNGFYEIVTPIPYTNPYTNQIEINISAREILKDCSYQLSIMAKNSHLPPPEFERFKEQFILSREEEGKTYGNQNQVIAGLQKYINSCANNYRNGQEKQNQPNKTSGSRSISQKPIRTVRESGGFGKL